MVKERADRKTLDLLSWEPKDIVKRFEDSEIRAASLGARIAHAVSRAMEDCAFGRENIAKRMSDYLGETVTVNMLNASASEARRDQNIPFIRLIALVYATNDLRLLQLAAEPFGHSVVDDRYLEWVRYGQLTEKKEELEKERESARRNAQRGRK